MTLKSPYLGIEITEVSPSEYRLVDVEFGMAVTLTWPASYGIPTEQEVDKEIMVAIANRLSRKRHP